MMRDRAEWYANVKERASLFRAINVPDPKRDSGMHRQRMR